MRYLLDTCVFSDLVKAQPQQSVVDWILSCNEDQMYVSVLTFGEIQKEIAMLNDELRKDRLQHWLDKDLQQRFSGRILGITAEVVLTWGVLQGDSELKGKVIASIDGLFVAIAKVYNLTIVTRKIKDMNSLGISHLNPWAL